MKRESIQATDTPASAKRQGYRDGLELMYPEYRGEFRADYQAGYDLGKRHSHMSAAERLFAGS